MIFIYMKKQKADGLIIRFAKKHLIPSILGTKKTQKNFQYSFNFLFKFF